MIHQGEAVLNPQAAAIYRQTVANNNSTNVAIYGGMSISAPNPAGWLEQLQGLQ
jgi:hypothetical protein